MSFQIREVQQRLAAGNGGYEIVHESPGLEIGVYVLVAPEPDRQQPHANDEVYVVLEGSGALEVEGEQTRLREGEAIFVPAGADHRLVGYENLSVLVIFARALDRRTKSGQLVGDLGQAARRADARHTERASPRRRSSMRVGLPSSRCPLAASRSPRSSSYATRSVIGPLPLLLPSRLSSCSRNSSFPA